MGEPLEYIHVPGRYKGNVPLSLAVRAGNLVFVSGIPAFDPAGKLAVGDFPAQMTQVMENIDAVLKEAGCGWDRVARTKVFLTRAEDFDEMNRIYRTRFASGAFPARSTLFVQALPHPDFLVELECEAVLPSSFRSS